MIVNAGISPLIASVCAILMGALMGLLNGVLIAKFKLQPMIATLGTMSIARGAALTLAGGRTITGYGASFRWIGSGSIPGTEIPVQIIFMLLLYALIFYLLRFRKTGRYIYSIGGNEEATRLSGINVIKYKTVAYIISGVLSAMAGIILVSKLNSAQSIAGEGYELDAIASSVIGGASLLGGFGSVWGTLLGAIIMGVIRNGLVLMNISSNLQHLIIGVIIIAAVLLDTFRNRAKR
jgi:ribose transport system permease protein